MKLPDNRLEGTLVSRYKRFLADIRLDNGKIVTVHCPNSGSMKSCAVPGRRVVVSRSDNPKRKYPLTLELIHSGKSWIGVNTTLTNHIAEEAVRNRKILELSGYKQIKKEAVVAPDIHEGTRFDLLLSGGSGPDCYVEIKSVTLLEDGQYRFPDAVTTRGRKHLEVLMRLQEAGFRAVQLYIIQRRDGSGFRPAVEIDPAYAAALHRATKAGVEVLAYGTIMRKDRILVDGPVPLEIPPSPE